MELDYYCFYVFIWKKVIKCCPQEWRREDLLVKSSRNGRWVQLKKWLCQWPAVAMLFSCVQVKAILRRMLVTQPHAAEQGTAGLGQRVITLSVARPAPALSHLQHKISLNINTQGPGKGISSSLTGHHLAPGVSCLLSLWSPCCGWCCSSGWWLVTIPPIPVTAQPCSSAQLGSPHWHTALRMRLLSLGLNDLTTSKTCTWSSSVNVHHY